MVMAALTGAVEASAAMTTYDFEAGPQGWTTSGTANEWQRGTSIHHLAHSGVAVWDTNLIGDYTIGSDSYLISPPIAIAPTGGDLTWWGIDDYGYRGTEGTAARVQVAWANESQYEEAWHTEWNEITGDAGHETEWKERKVSLYSWRGQTVQIRFLFQSMPGYHDGHTHPGWHIDDVTIPGSAPDVPGKTPEVRDPPRFSAP